MIVECVPENENSDFAALLHRFLSWARIECNKIKRFYIVWCVFEKVTVNISINASINDFIRMGKTRIKKERHESLSSQCKDL